MATTMRGFGAQNMMLMRNDTTPGSDSLVAMLASCTPMGLQVPGHSSVGGLEDAVVGCGMKRSFSYPSFVDHGSSSPGLGGEEALMGLDDGMDDCSPCSMSNVEKKRRLSFEQVKSLERNFELENKLEPEKKMQLAKELGLQPRQVAVWFQNRRARWKTKQLERDYEVLSQEYNRLKSEYDAVVLEKEKLESEIQHLTGKSTQQSINMADQSRDQYENVEPSAISGVKIKTTDHSGAKLSRGADLQQVQVGVKSESMIRTDASTEVVLKTRPADSQWKQQASTSPTVEIPASILKAEKLEQHQTTSTSASNSSEILDTDSPRTIDNYKLQQVSIITAAADQQAGAGTVTSCQHLNNPGSADDQCFMDPASCLLQVAAAGGGDDLMCAAGAADRVLSSPQLQYHRSAGVAANIKLELDAAAAAGNCSNYQAEYVDQSCNYFLSQLDDKAGATPWWDWA